MEETAKTDLTVWPLYLFLSVLVGIGVYYAVKITKTTIKVLMELIVAYQVFTGGSSQQGTKRPLRMYVFTCETKNLDEVAVNELYRFLTGSQIKSEIGGEDKTVQALHKVLLSYSHVILYRDKIDGSLRGMATLGFEHKKEYTILKMGLSFFKNYYQGGPFLLISVGYFVLKELIRHPLTPVYIVGKAYGYKSYLFALKFKESYPRCDRETPEFFKKMFKEYAQSVMAEGDTYDEDTNVLEQERTHLTENLLATEQDLKSPHIKFFVERNPGYAKGHCLVAGWRAGWYDLVTLLSQVFKNSTKPKEAGSGGTRRRKPKLLKRLTFQEAAANAYAMDMYQMGLGGESVLTPTNGFAIGPLSPTQTEDLPVF